MIYGKITLKDWRTIRIEGEQPESFFESPDLRLFFYGKLYNRDALQATQPETNAQLAATVYSKDPQTGFSRLDGSFLIVYYSAERSGVVRDHHGTYYPVYATPDGHFSTSWQYLAEHDKIDYTYNPVALSRFLQRGVMSGADFAISDFLSLNAGEQFCKHFCGQLTRHKVFVHTPKEIKDSHPDIKSCSRRYGELHARAIQRRIGDSRRVGILLSGGYDSGSNLAALRSFYDGPIDSYSVGFKGDTWTELPMARLMSETFNTRHHEYEIDGTEINALPDIVRFLGEPFVEGGLMVNYCAMRMIGADKPDVILGGDGSDQYFGTTGREVALHYLAARIGARPLLGGIHKLLAREMFDKGGKLSRINFHLDKLLHVLEGERFGFSDSALCKLLQHPKMDFMPSSSVKADTRSFESLYTQHALVSDLEIVIDRIILYKASRMAQMFGNNLTYPFVDLDLYHFLQELPVNLKCKGDSTLAIARGRSISKYLLKYHYKPLLPPAITSRKKQGGFAPMPLFFRDAAQRARLKEFILSSNIFDQYLSREGVEKFLADYDRLEEQTGIWFWHKQNKALQYFNLLTLVVWWEEFVVGREVKF